MDTAQTDFPNLVERFCAWAEGQTHGLVEARRFLLQLMAAIPELRPLRYAGYGGALDFPRREHDQWQQDLQRFADLPFQYYRTVFDPHDFDASDEPVGGDLHDDLADIYGDLWHGAQAFRAGETEHAFSLWIDSYFSHWGRHASGALQAIDCWYRDHADDPVETGDGSSPPDGGESEEQGQ